MTIESVPGRVAILVICNFPVMVGFGSLFFSSWGDFFKAFVPGLDFRFWSWVLDWHTYMTWENNKLVLFLLLVALALYGEYRHFWPSPPEPKSVQFISQKSGIALTPSSTRTPPALPPALSQHPAFSAPLSASVQAGPVSFFR